MEQLDEALKAGDYHHRFCMSWDGKNFVAHIDALVSVNPIDWQERFIGQGETMAEAIKMMLHWRQVFIAAERSGKYNATAQAYRDLGLID